MTPHSTERDRDGRVAPESALTAKARQQSKNVMYLLACGTALSVMVVATMTAPFATTMAITACVVVWLIVIGVTGHRMTRDIDTELLHATAEERRSFAWVLPLIVTLPASQLLADYVDGPLAFAAAAVLVGLITAFVSRGIARELRS